MSTRAPSRTMPIDIEAGGNGSTDVVVNGVFLSPRVIDRRAYSELSGELRELVEKSAVERGALVAALDQASQTVADLRQGESAQNSNIELAARALRAMDERMSRVETLLARAEAQGKIFEQLEARAGGMIESKVQVLQARLEAVQSAATAKTEALEERIRRVSRELEQRIEAIRRDADSIAGPAQAALSGLCDRAGAILGRDAGSTARPTEGSLGDVVERAEALAGEVMRVSKSLEDGSERLELSRRQAAELTVRQQEIEGRTEELRSNVERNLEIVRSRLQQQQLEMVSRAQEVVDGAQESVQRLEAQAAEAREAGARAFAELRSSIQQSIDAHNTTTLALRILNTSIDQAKVLSAQLEPWRGLLDSSGTGQMPLAIRRMIEGVRGELTTELSSIAGALRSAAEKAERAGRSMDAASKTSLSGPITTPIPSAMSAGTPPASNPLVGARVSRPAIANLPGKDIPMAARPTKPVDAAD